MAYVAPAGDAAVAERRVAELGAVLYRNLQTATWSNVTDLTCGAARRNVVWRWCNNAKTYGRYGITRRRSHAMTLRTVGTGRGRVRVNSSNSRYY